MKVEDNSRVFYPPGGILIWMVVFLELITFSLILLVFLNQRQADIASFNLSQQSLNTNLGLLNTIILLTSGLFMVSSLVELKSGSHQKAILYLTLTILFGIAFLMLKGFEFYEKIQSGIDLSTNQFFQFYWFLTGFHFLHVLVGIVLLSFILFKTRAGFYSRTNYEDAETVGVFWHMCDLIWIILFPIVYLLN
jgi:nitric oxide reductase NorE protein